MGTDGQVNAGTGPLSSPSDIERFRAALLDWYDREGRTLPWRIRPDDRARGEVADPYRVWLSEVMLQQTTVAHGTRYWQAFVKAFPTVCDLSRADADTVMGMWAGLGYYARARNLHACAKRVCDDMGGLFPTDEATLLTLPGIGPYTAAAIAAICAGEATNVVDGNIERVVSRLFAVEVPLPKARTTLRKLAATLVRPDRAGDYPQALMDLGATVCRPRVPLCMLCPVSEWCVARAQGDPARYPLRAKKAVVPTRRGYAYVLTRGDDVWLERRPDSGLLGGMLGFPTSDWGELPEAGQEDRQGAPADRNWRPCGTARHTFSHFHLELDVFAAEGESRAGEPGQWIPRDRLGELPSVMAKVWALASPRDEEPERAPGVTDTD